MPERETNVDAKIARVDQHLSDFEREVNRRFEEALKTMSAFRDDLKSTNGRLLGLALSIAGSSALLALTTLLATGKLG